VGEKTGSSQKRVEILERERTGVARRRVEELPHNSDQPKKEAGGEQRRAEELIRVPQR